MAKMSATPKINNLDHNILKYHDLLGQMWFSDENDVTFLE